MKAFHKSTHQGFTLVELLVVIAIIGILAAMLIPATIKMKTNAKRTEAKTQIGFLTAAIHDYETTYNGFPVSSAAIQAATTAGEDFTYGGIFKTPLGLKNVQGPYMQDNSEIMGVLLNLETFGNGNPTINAGHVKNTQSRIFLSPKMSGDIQSAGVGLDGVYRDPWGTPIVITIDLNHDDKTRDAFYSSAAVSSISGSPNAGLQGLMPRTLPTGTVFESSFSVMVWSAGQDKMIDPNEKADKGANKDNIISWY